MAGSISANSYLISMPASFRALIDFLIVDNSLFNLFDISVVIIYLFFSINAIIAACVSERRTVESMVELLVELMVELWWKFKSGKMLSF